MVENSWPTGRSGIGHIGMVWLLLVVSALPVVAALLGRTDWGALPSLGVLGVSIAAYKLFAHYRGPNGSQRGR
jgi:hypothetical protein